MPRARPPELPVLRLTVLWAGAVVDSFPVDAGARSVHALRGGGRLEAAWDAEDGVLVLTLDGADVVEVAPGGAAQLGGFDIRCHLGVRHPRARRPLLFDGRWLHAVVLAAAFQICVVSALLLAPAPVVDPEPGAGLTMADLERFLAVPAGGARREGRATFAPVGERPDEGERVHHERPPLHVARRDVPTVTWSTTPTYLADSVRSLLGDEGGTSDLARTLGEEALATARSEQASAGVGGLLSPRPLVEPGAGTGTVGIGRSRTAKLVEENDRRLDQKNVRRVKLPPREPRAPEVQQAVFPVKTAALPEGDVSIDPVVKDFLATSVRRHKNSIRYCYETFGLAADPRRSGRLVLELTLLPDGHVRDVDATVDGKGLEAVARCVEEQASQWFLGGALMDGPRRLRFPFRLCPKPSPDAMVWGECEERWPSAGALRATTLSARQ